jgi:hypothetical protein
LPIYDYECKTCGWKGERRAPVDEMDEQYCGNSYMCHFEGKGSKVHHCSNILTHITDFSKVVIHIPPSMRAC